MSRIISPNLRHLVRSYKNPEISGAVLEGSSRSTKTWSGIDFINLICARYEPKGCTIHVLRETYNSFKTTLYDDFKRRFRDLGIITPFEYDIQDITEFKLFKSKIHLIGADKPSKALGSGCDYFFMNEAVEISREIFDQKEMRCRKFWWMDYNPSFEEHYIYDSVVTRPDVAYLRTTFLDNPYITKIERNKILSYNPDNPQNVKNGTASQYDWDVFGLGKRASPKGLVFPYWKEYAKLPDELEYYKMFVVDWGGTDPTTLAELNINHKTKSVYIREHIYQPEILNNQFIKRVLEVNPDNHEVICDSSRSDKIYELQMANINAFGAKKGPNSIIDGFDILKEYNIFVHVESLNAKKEFNSYKWATNKQSGKSLNKPEDKNNHIIDPTRYGVRYYHLNYGI